MIRFNFQLTPQSRLIPSAFVRKDMSASPYQSITTCTYDMIKLITMEK